MYRQSRHANGTSIIDFSDFSGGLNFLTTPENIAQNELAECVNFTYSEISGKLKTRNGLGTEIASFDNTIDGIYYYKTGDYLLIASGQKLYKSILSNTHGEEATITEIGNLTGDKRPSFCDFGTDVFIATGGKIQKFDGTNLSTISSSPENAIGLYAKAGRLFCWINNSDILHGSAVGDGSSWSIPENPTEADPCEVQIGYKTAGNIIACIPLLADVIIFKSFGAFRLINEYPDWIIKEISRDEILANKNALTNIAGLLYYLDNSKGIRLLQGSASYEEISTSDTLLKLNSYIRKNLNINNCRLWNLKNNNILLIGIGNNECLPCYYEFGLNNMPGLLWRFNGNFKDILEIDKNNIYCAIDNNLYDFSGWSNYEKDLDGNLNLVNCYFKTKLFRNLSGYLIKRIATHANNNNISQNIIETPALVSINDKIILELYFEKTNIDLVYGNFNLVYGNTEHLVIYKKNFVDFVKHNLFRTKELQITFDGSQAPFELTKFYIELASVGVIG